jgi:hypothetical protein
VSDHPHLGARSVHPKSGQAHGPEAPRDGLLLTGAPFRRLPVTVMISTGIAKSLDWPLGFKQNTKPTRMRGDRAEPGQSAGTLKRVRARNPRLGASKMDSSDQMIDALVACPAGVTLKATRTLPSRPARRACTGYQSMVPILESGSIKCGVFSLAASSPRLTLSTQHARTATPQPQSKRSARRIRPLAIASLERALYLALVAEHPQFGAAEQHDAIRFHDSSTDARSRARQAQPSAETQSGPGR